MLSDWFLWISVCKQGVVWRCEDKLKGRLSLWQFPSACPPSCPPCPLLCWRDALSQGIRQPADQQGCYATPPSVVPLLALTARLRKAKSVSSLVWKDSPCSLNNSKHDVCVTPRCHTWLMKSSAWSPGSTTTITLPLGLQYWELGKSCLSKVESQQKPHNTQQNRRWKCNSFIPEHFILPDSSSRLTSDDQACFWLSTDPDQEEKAKAAPSCSYWSVSGPSMPAWEWVRLPLVWTCLVSVFLPR